MISKANDNRYKYEIEADEAEKAERIAAMKKTVILNTLTIDQLLEKIPYVTAPRKPFTTSEGSTYRLQGKNTGMLIGYVTLGGKINKLVIAKRYDFEEHENIARIFFAAKLNMEIH